MRLPDVSITDKNDTFHLHGESCSTFRLMAQAVTRDLFGKAVPLPIPPAISGKFVVGTCTHTWSTAAALRGSVLSQLV